MNRDVMYHITSDNVVFPQSSLPNTKMLLYKDMHNRHWQLIPVTNPAVMFPFIIKPLSEEKFNELKEKEK